MRFLAPLTLAFVVSGCGGVLDDSGSPITVEPDSLRLWVGEAATISPTESRLGSRIVYSTSDPTVVSVSAAGTVEGRGHGEAWIIVEALGSQARPDSVRITVDDWRVTLSQVSMAATIVNSGGSYVGKVQLYNQGVSALRLGYGRLCMPYMVLNRADDSATWNQLHWWHSRPGGCKWTPVELILPPGHSLEISTPPASAASILGDSLPSGAYNGTIRFVLAHWHKSAAELSAVVDTVLNLPAGSAGVAPFE